MAVPIRQVQAVQAGSVLDTRRVAALLSQLTPTERARAIDGLALLARAAESLPKPRRSGA